MLGHCARIRYVGRQALKRDRIRSQGYAFQIETTTQVRRQGFRVVEIPIVFREREQGVSKLSGHVVWEAIWVVARLGLTW